MNTNALAGKAISNAVPVALGIGVILFAVYFVLRKAVGDTVGVVANTAAGVVSGNNAITEGTAYEGAGIAGTLGAVANSASGGALQWLGESVSSWFSPDLPEGSLITYIAIFPDGSKHAVDGMAVDKQGFFTRDGIRYRLGTSASNQRVAVRV